MTTGRRVVSARTLLASSELPRHEALRLLEKATGLSRGQLVSSDAVATEGAKRYRALVERRSSGEPLQYIEGTVQFGPHELEVDCRVLVPRPETEQLWELATAALGSRRPRIIVDLGTGSGNLAIAMKAAYPAAAVHAVDVSPEALAVAANNVARSGLQIELYLGDLFGPLPTSIHGRVDLVISNPPYIALGDAPDLPAEVRDHEPAAALFGGEDGLAVVRRVVAEAAEWLAPGGLLACEIGAQQGPAVRAMTNQLETSILQDLSGRDRFVLAEKGAV